MLKKIFFTAFLFFSFLCAAEENTLSSLFFDGAKYAITGISSDPKAREIASVSLKSIRRFYSTRVATFDEKHRLVPLYAAEILNKERTGEIDCLYDENDLVSFFEEKFGAEDDENKQSETGSIDAIDEAVSTGGSFSGDWIDQAIALSSMQPPQQKAAQVNDGQSLLDYLEQGDSRGIAEQSEEKTLGKNDEDGEGDESGQAEEKKEFTYFDKSGALRRFFYDGEGVSVNSHGGKIYITKTYGKNISRKSFDAAFRLLSEEKFSFDLNPKDVSLDSIKTYVYHGESSIPSQMKETRFAKKTADGASRKDGDIEIETKFNSAGLASQIKTGHWEAAAEDKPEESKNQTAKTAENEGKAEKAEKVKFLDDKNEAYLYDEQNRIVEYALETWTYKKNLLGRTIVQALKTKYEYSYHDAENSSAGGQTANIPPDYKFYEDGELRMERIYSAEDDFTEKMIFSDGFYVEASYVDGVKKEEIVYDNGKEARRRVF